MRKNLAVSALLSGLAAIPMAVPMAAPARAGEAEVVRAEAQAEGGGRARVTEGQFVYVALDAEGWPRPVPQVAGEEEGT